MRFCEKLRQLQKERGFSNRWLADRVGVNETTVGRWMKTNKGPHINAIRARLCEVLHVNIDDLFARAPTDSPSAPIPILGSTAAGLLATGAPDWIEAGRVRLVDLEVRILVRRVLESS